MGYEAKVWKDRKSSYPGRRMLTYENGTVERVTVARDEGDVSVEGDAFSEDNMNDLEQRIQNAFNERITEQEIDALLTEEVTT